MNKAIFDFARKLEEAGPDAIGFFYYSGHGVARSRERVNYMIPIDVQDMSNDDFWYRAVPFDRILNELRLTRPERSPLSDIRRLSD